MNPWSHTHLLGDEVPEAKFALTKHFVHWVSRVDPDVHVAHVGWHAVLTQLLLASLLNPLLQTHPEDVKNSFGLQLVHNVGPAPEQVRQVESQVWQAPFASLYIPIEQMHCPFLIDAFWSLQLVQL
jgi:hypothetical protein